MEYRKLPTDLATELLKTTADIREICDLDGVYELWGYEMGFRWSGAFITKWNRIRRNDEGEWDIWSNGEIATEIRTLFGYQTSTQNIPAIYEQAKRHYSYQILSSYTKTSIPPERPTDPAARLVKKEQHIEDLNTLIVSLLDHIQDLELRPPGEGGVAYLAAKAHWEDHLTTNE